MDNREPTTRKAIEERNLKVLERWANGEGIADIANSLGNTYSSTANKIDYEKNRILTFLGLTKEQGSTMATKRTWTLLIDEFRRKKEARTSKWDNI